MVHLRKTKKEYKSLKKQEIQDIFIKTGDKACFQHDMAYGDFKDLAKKTAFNKILPDEAFSITKNPKYDRYQRGLPLMVYKCFDRKTSGSVIENENISNNEWKNYTNQLL